MSVFQQDDSESNAVNVVACVDSLLLHDTVLAAVESGWLLSFGSSRDGGAVSVRVLHDDGRESIWASSVPELEKALRAVLTACGGGEGRVVAERGPSGSGGPTAASAGKGKK